MCVSLPDENVVMETGCNLHGLIKPEEVEFRPSQVEEGKPGLWCIQTINEGTLFGPYAGEVLKDKHGSINYRYAWEVWNLESNKLLHIINATNPEYGNWMRYVNCARYFEEQNIVSVQINEEIYYKAIKEIEIGQELLTWFDLSERNITKKQPKEKQTTPVDNKNKTVKKKKKENGDSSSSLQNKVQPCITAALVSKSTPQKRKIDTSMDYTKTLAVKKKKKAIQTTMSYKVSKTSTDSSSPNSSKSHDSITSSRKISTTSKMKVEIDVALAEQTKIFEFHIQKQRFVIQNGKKIYSCAVCNSMYVKPFCLKRHYLRTHINSCYLSTSDITNCCIDFSQQTLRIKNAQKVQSSGCKLFNGLIRSQISSPTKDVTPSDKTENEWFPGLFTCNECYFVFDECQQLVVHLKNHDSKTIRRKQKKKVKNVTSNDNSKAKLLKNPSKLLPSTENLSFNKSVSKSPTKLSPNKATMKTSLEKSTLQSGSRKLISKSLIVKSTEQSNDRKTMHLLPSKKCDEPSQREKSPTKTFTEKSPTRKSSSKKSPAPKTPPKKPLQQSKMRKYNKSPVKGLKTSIPFSPNKSPFSFARKSPRSSPRSPFLKKKMKPRGSKYMKSELKKFPCTKCRVRFSRATNLEKHMKEHKENKIYPCYVCGKQFMSDTKMKQHIRYHFGQNVSCRHCSQKFPNVGTMRQHLLHTHKEEWLINGKDGAQKSEDSKEKKTTKIMTRKKKIQVISELDFRAVIPDSNLIQPTIKESLSTSSPNKLYKVLSSPVSNKKKLNSEDTENIQAQNGYKSKLRYSCFTCKKRFVSYYSLVQHRRSNHRYDIYNAPSAVLHMKQKVSEAKNPIGNLPMLSPPISPNVYYATINNNVSTNLTSFLDGKADAIKNFKKHVKISGYKSFSSVAPTKFEKFVWPNFNFPYHYQPYESVIGYSSITQERIIPVDISATFDLDFKNNKSANLKSGKLESLKELKLDISSETPPILSCMTSPQRRASNDSDAKSMPSLTPTYDEDPTKQFFCDLDSVSNDVHVLNSGSTCEQNCEACSNLSNMACDVSVKTESALKSVKDNSVNTNNNSIVPILDSLKLIKVSDKDDVMDRFLTANRSIPAHAFQNDLRATLAKQSWDTYYDGIAFGKLGSITNVCSVCKRYFDSVDLLVRHQWTRHSSMICRFLQMEKGHDIDSLFYSWPCNEGLVASSTPIPEDCHSLDAYKCTYCKSSFKNINRLHVHIISCDPKKLFYVEKLSLKERRKQAAKERKEEESAKAKQQGRKKPNTLLVSKVQLEKKRKQEKLKKIIKERQRGKSSSKSLQKSLKSKTETESKQHGLSPRSLREARRNQADLLSTSDSRITRQRKRRNYELLYVPKNHVRRREMANIVETHQCSGCTSKFRTLFLLERHARKCSEKDKLQSTNSSDGSNSPTKSSPQQICQYCNRMFTYMKSLANHYRDFCPVKKEKHQNAEVNTDQLQAERSLLLLVNGNEDGRNDNSLEDGADGDEESKQRCGWPKGMKRKNRRKNHSWTYTKKKKMGSCNGDIDLDNDERIMKENTLAGGVISESEKDFTKSNYKIPSPDKDLSKPVKGSAKIIRDIPKEIKDLTKPDNDLILPETALSVKKMDVETESNICGQVSEKGDRHIAKQDISNEKTDVPKVKTNISKCEENLTMPVNVSSLEEDHLSKLEVDHSYSYKRSYITLKPTGDATDLIMKCVQKDIQNISKLKSEKNNSNLSISIQEFHGQKSHTSIDKNSPDECISVYDFNNSNTLSTISETDVTNTCTTADRDHWFNDVTQINEETSLSTNDIDLYEEVASSLESIQPLINGFPSITKKHADLVDAQHSSKSPEQKKLQQITVTQEDSKIDTGNQDCEQPTSNLCNDDQKLFLLEIENLGSCIEIGQTPNSDQLYFINNSYALNLIPEGMTSKPLEPVHSNLIQESTDNSPPDCNSKIGSTVSSNNLVLKDTTENQKRVDINSDCVISKYRDSNDMNFEAGDVIVPCEIAPDTESTKCKDGTSYSFSSGNDHMKLAADHVICNDTENYGTYKVNCDRVTYEEIHCELNTNFNCSNNTRHLSYQPTSDNDNTDNESAFYSAETETDTENFNYNEETDVDDAVTEEIVNSGDLEVSSINTLTEHNYFSIPCDCKKADSLRNTDSMKDGTLKLSENAEMSQPSDATGDNGCQSPTIVSPDSDVSR